MRINSIAITNYRSFHERQQIKLDAGFNVILGANNAGKTTVLDALDFNQEANEPHRSEQTIVAPGQSPLGISEIDVEFVTDIGSLIQAASPRTIFLPLNKRLREAEPRVKLKEQLKAFVQANGQLKFAAHFGGGSFATAIEGPHLIGGTVFGGSGDDTVEAASIQSQGSNKDCTVDLASFGGVRDTIASYFHYFKSHVFRFNARRQPGSISGAAEVAMLDRDATNLPFCINHLGASDPAAHEELCKWVNRIFPSIHWVQAPPIGADRFRLECLQIPKGSRRRDLAIPASQMGTGIGNVIAMLYVVLSAEKPQAIAIDELNAYLHPKAIRELLGILQSEGQQHQFVLTAHSADVLSSVRPSTITNLSQGSARSTVASQVAGNELRLLKAELAELGIRMSDLHSRDKVLWVEGQTEELVLPELLQFCCPEVAAGTAVLRVENTGAFGKRKIEPGEVAKIYERLLTSAALVPPIVCVLLDSEGKSREERDRKERDSGGLLKYLDRRMLENYLLHPEAARHALQTSNVALADIDVAAVISTELGDKDVVDADGAKILNSLFWSLSKETTEFQKTRHIPLIVTWLIENDPEHVQPLRLFLRKLFGLDEAHLHTIG